VLVVSLDLQKLPEYGSWEGRASKSWAQWLRERRSDIFWSPPDGTLYLALDLHQGLLPL
jgi:hypothetical protein